MQYTRRYFLFQYTKPIEISNGMSYVINSYEKVLECLQSPSIKNAATTDDDAYLVNCGTCYI